MNQRKLYNFFLFHLSSKENLLACMIDEYDEEFHLSFLERNQQIILRHSRGISTGIDKDSSYCS